MGRAIAEAEIATEPRIARTRTSGAPKPSRLREGAGVLVAALGLYVLVSVVSYHPLDPSFNASLAGGGVVHNRGGIVGAYLSDVLVQVLGLGSYVVVGLLFAVGGRLAIGRALAVTRDQTLACAFALFSATVLLELAFGVVPIGGRPAPAGGAVGRLVAGFLVHWVNVTGAALFSTALFVLAFTVVSGGSVSAVLGTLFKLAALSAAAVRDVLSRRGEAPRKRPVLKPREKETEEERQQQKEWEAPDLLDIVREGVVEEREEAGLPGEGPRIVEPVVWRPKKEKEKEKAPEKEKLEVPLPEQGVYTLPDPSLLVSEDQKPREIDAEALKAQAEVLEKKLKDFGVFGRVVEVHPGPVITMFEFEPAPGIKVNRVANLVDDLKMAMKATSVRIVAPIPGKGTVGIEIPNETRETVYLKDILGHAEYLEKQTMTPIALGKDIAGKPIVADLSKMPHLLVAGTTGSGKSVSVNSMIMSILYRATPNDVRMLMIDPKMLEFSIYDGIPHLMLPVITNPKKASMALKWAVMEMERRYRLLADVNARNIVAYNKRIPKILEERAREEADQVNAHDPADGLPSEQALAEAEHAPLEHGHLPYIIIVIDELADLMIVAKNEVEEAITRLAQMARAAGIHLLIATQRPSVDVITGLIKANFPARIAFRVFSRIDSRTVLDMNGAEALLGEGDMLFLPPGMARLTRIHGAFVSDVEIQRVVDFLKTQGKPRYAEEILHTAPSESEGGLPGDDLSDELYDQAVAVVAETRQASISFLQRRLKVGYNRAARMIERMESEGIVGASDGVKPRPVLVQQIQG